MRSHTERAAVMYRSTAAASAAPSPQPPAPVSGQSLSRADASKVLYRPNAGVGTIDLALSSNFGRLRAGVTDPERLTRLDTQRLEVGRLLREKNVEPSAAQRMLSIFVDHQMQRRSEDALAKRWQGPAGYAEVRREAGSEEAANARLASTDRVLAAVAKVSPTFAQDLVNSGAAQHPDFIKTAAKIVEDLKPAQAPAKQI